MARFIPRTLRGQMPAKGGTPRRPARPRSGSPRSQPPRAGTDDQQYDEPPAPAAERGADEPFHIDPIAVEPVDSEPGTDRAGNRDNADAGSSAGRDAARRPSPRPRPGASASSEESTGEARSRRRRPSPRPKPSPRPYAADDAGDADRDAGVVADPGAGSKTGKAKPSRPPVKAPARLGAGARGGKTSGAGKSGKAGRSGPAGKPGGRAGKAGKAALARRRRAERALERTHRAIVIVGVLAVLALAAGGGAWWLHLRDDAVEQARDDAVSAAQAAAPALLSYDYRTFDASVRRAKPYLGGSFAKKYAKTTASLKKYAVKQKAILTARVSATSVVSAQADRVVLLLYVDQYKQNTTITGQKVDQNRVVLTMTPMAGKWKVTKVTAI
ncbi:hypothetical protein Athai_53950 [Actinocatenispora thailandica]|uniref:Mce-associated membrane protein n=1 Tax=Actinocatenispora thailandica TaxID=227318 RepID=A0A7R7DV46_9ACTN|nr:hypothetical protein [Actinocatenispora thailandica]BCJ37892.1 hypothetical protein Athai_53950 [Actinocatenispora thailandica]